VLGELHERLGDVSLVESAGQQPSMLIDALKRAVLIPATVEEQSFEVSA
jgi:hypothetical protein